jgi:hypothetical protein
MPYPVPYPAGNEFPTIGEFEAHFRNYAAGNFSLQPGTDWANAGTDGLDLGAIGTAPTVSAPRSLRIGR